MAEARVIRFCVQVGYITSKYMEDKSPLKGTWSGSRDPFLGQHFNRVDLLKPVSNVHPFVCPQEVSSISMKFGM